MNIIQMTRMLDPEEQERRFQQIIKSAADSVDLLRASDLSRVVAEANNQGLGKEFLAWLKTQPLSVRTAQRLSKAYE